MRVRVLNSSKWQQFRMELGNHPQAMDDNDVPADESDAMKTSIPAIGISDVAVGRMEYLDGLRGILCLIATWSGIYR